jgi:hypothetical protein
MRKDHLSYEMALAFNSLCFCANMFVAVRHRMQEVAARGGGQMDRQQRPDDTNVTSAWQPPTSKREG